MGAWCEAGETSRHHCIGRLLFFRVHVSLAPSPAEGLAVLGLEKTRTTPHDEDDHVGFLSLSQWTVIVDGVSAAVRFQHSPRSGHAFALIASSCTET